MRHPSLEVTGLEYVVDALGFAAPDDRDRCVCAGIMMRFACLPGGIL